MLGSEVQPAVGATVHVVCETGGISVVIPADRQKEAVRHASAVALSQLAEVEMIERIRDQIGILTHYIEGEDENFVNPHMMDGMKFMIALFGLGLIMAREDVGCSVVAALQREQSIIDIHLSGFEVRISIGGTSENFHTLYKAKEETGILVIH